MPAKTLSSASSAAAPSFGRAGGDGGPPRDSSMTPRGGGGGEGGDGKERSLPFVSVAVRVKPTSATGDAIAVWPKVIEGDERCQRVCCHRGYLLEEYEFSRVFRPEDDNHRLFEGLHGHAIAESVFTGVSETLFAYGQTGSGKTHTIFGTPNEPGLLQYFVRAVFERAEQCVGSTVHVCCYEVLGDNLTDLINPDPMVKRGVLKKEDVVCDELFLKTQKFRYKIVQVAKKSTCMDLLQDARMNRAVGFSSCNASSSRSHAIVHVFVQNPALVESGADGGGVSSSIGALTLVDLAGTEKEHENPSEQGRKSARVLNTSLSSLNRLLRKLQTNTLDESERRQSVLNKCLWEYLRPGCGIALIFCVSPLFRHRATSFSTLSMATASKLINSRRKSQYIQAPSGTLKSTSDGQPQNMLAASPCAASSPHAAWPSSSPAGTPRAGRASTETAKQRGRTPDAASTPCKASSTPCGTPRNAPVVPRVSTPRRTSTSTPAGTRKSSGIVASCAASTPRGRFGSSPFCMSTVTGLEDNQDHGCRDRGHVDKQAPNNLQLLELQNEKLKRRLSKSRVRSRDRIVSVAQERDQLSAENGVLRQECDSLRSLFIRQQQQQIAFWAGPIMEMVLPKSRSQSHTSCESLDGHKKSADDTANPKLATLAAVRAAASPSKARRTVGSLSAVTAFSDVQDAAEPSLVQDAFLGSYVEAPPRELDVTEAHKPVHSLAGTGAARPECVQSLLKDRDYWQKVAGSLQTQIRKGTHTPIIHLSLEKGTIETRSSSHQSSHSSNFGSASLHCSAESECGGQGETTWSDSGTESTRTAET